MSGANAKPKPYYDHAGITIYHGDCREFFSLPFDVLVTDPPYGVNLGKHASAGRDEPKQLGKIGYETYDDTDENLRSIVVPAVSCFIGRSVRACVFCAGGKIGAFPEPSCVGGVYVPSAVARNSWGFQNYNFILFYGVAPRMEKGCYFTTLKSTDAASKSGHPCPKPLSWMRWIVERATSPGDVVLDPFMGSGTTLRAAKDLGLKAVGIEMEEKYCEIAARRLDQEVLQF